MTRFQAARLVGILISVPCKQSKIFSHPTMFHRRGEMYHLIIFFILVLGFVPFRCLNWVTLWLGLRSQFLLPFLPFFFALAVKGMMSSLLLSISISGIVLLGPVLSVSTYKLGTLGLPLSFVGAFLCPVLVTCNGLATHVWQRFAFQTAWRDLFIKNFFSAVSTIFVGFANKASQFTQYLKV